MNVVEEHVSEGTTTKKNQKESTKTFNVKEQLEAVDYQMSDDKEVLKQIALFKAMDQGNREMQENIRLGRLLDDELTSYLCEGYEPEDLHLFIRNERRLMEEERRQRRTKKDMKEAGSDSDQSDWNTEDGMTKSIMSSQEPNEFKQSGLRDGKLAEE